MPWSPAPTSRSTDVDSQSSHRVRQRHSILGLVPNQSMMLWSPAPNSTPHLHIKPVFDVQVRAVTVQAQYQLSFHEDEQPRLQEVNCIRKLQQTACPQPCEEQSQLACPASRRQLHRKAATNSASSTHYSQHTWSSPCKCKQRVPCRRMLQYRVHLNRRTYRRTSCIQSSVLPSGGNHQR